MALASNGFPVISYYDKTNGDLKLAVCNNTLCTSPTLQTIDSDGDVGYYPSLKLNNKGFPVIAYCTKKTNEGLKLAVCNNTLCSSPLLRTVDGLGAYYPSLKLNSNGFPVIAYINSNYASRLAVCNDSLCTSPSLRSVDSRVGFELSLALKSNGIPIMAGYDPANQCLRLAVCNDSLCTSPTLRTVGSAGATGPRPSLALNSNGFAVIVYFDNTSKDLILAVCNNSLCTSPTLQTVDNSAGYVESFPSLALKSNGLPVIAYRDNINFDLKLAVCNDTLCTSSTLRTVDSALNVGMYPSLALSVNGSGFPVIAYFDTTNGDLKLAICNDPTCS